MRRLSTLLAPRSLAPAVGLLLASAACSGTAADAPVPARIELDLSGLDAGLERVTATGRSTSAAAGAEPGAPAGKAPSLTPSQGGGSAEAAATAPPEPAGSQALQQLAATTIATTVYERPDTSATRIGYIRVGGRVGRAPDSVSGRGCKGEWYPVEPHGFVCTDEATLDLSDPLVRAAAVRPRLDRALPYQYGFVRATAPQYLRIPTLAEQRKSEFKLDEHLQWYRDNYHEVQRVTLGANDVPVTAAGPARLGQPGLGGALSTQLTTTELLGGSSARGTIPFWLQGGRHIPNISSFMVPEYAVFADRVRRKTGLSFVDAFIAEDEGVERRFAVTVDMRLIPATKVKPDTGSAHHGLLLTDKTKMPFAFVIKRNAETWKLIKGRDEASGWGEHVPRRGIVPLSGHVRFKAGRRFYQTARSKTHWLRQDDVSVVVPPSSWPAEAESGGKWIDISLRQQTLVLYEGKRAHYATIVSTGRDRLGDPNTSLATPQGEFRIQSKHIAAAMDSEENSSVSGGRKSGRKLALSGDAAATRARLLAAEKAGKTLAGDDARRLANIKRGRHPEYGITMRRGTGGYELRDVPWIQYFAAGYALHGAYWHDVFGMPRSHGCINLAPIDARAVFLWTAPHVPEGWHGINAGGRLGDGTLVFIHE